jgi:uncharacterized SAM-binding protein YcdF (DUF218 family)
MRPLIDPVWILILLLSLDLFLLPKNIRLRKILIATSKFALSFLIFLSTGVATFIFDAILASESSPSTNWTPEFIFILGGGYEIAANESQDFLGTESTRRVNAASEIWLQYPLAKVVFSGQQPGTQDDRAASRHGELSSARALLIGLDKSRIIIESASENTRQHPIEALKLSGVKSNSKIAIVTSDFHLRRASGEFKKYFNDVKSFGTDEATNSISWLDFVPLATHLDANTYRIKEFTGILVNLKIL